MKKQTIKKYDISTLSGLLLLGVFAVCILSVLLTGAGAYRRLTERDNAALEQRTRIQYIVTKLRSAGSDAEIERFGDGDALVLKESYGGEVYLTRIYCYDGYLMELFSDAEGEFSPEDGERLIALDAMTLSENGNVITVGITGSSGESLTTSVLLRAKGASQ